MTWIQITGLAAALRIYIDVRAAAAAWHPLSAAFVRLPPCPGPPHLERQITAGLSFILRGATQFIPEFIKKSRARAHSNPTTESAAATAADGFDCSIYKWKVSAS